MITLIRLAEISLSKNDFDYAKDMVEVLKAYSDKENDLSIKSKYLLFKGHIKMGEGNNKEAREYFTEAKQMGEKYKMPHFVFEAEAMLEQLNPK